MNLVDALVSPGGLGLVLVFIFMGIMVIFAVAGRGRPRHNLREIPAFTKLGNAIGRAVESGTRLHISLGWGGVFDVQGTSGLVGLSLTERITRLAAVSDRPPVVTSGEGTLGILSQDSLRSVARAIGAAQQSYILHGRVSGLTPFSYAAGALPVILDEQVSATILTGHFGSEVALIGDACERRDGFTLAGSDSLPAQAVIAASVEAPIIGEEIFAAGAYVNAGPLHASSLRAQDIFRWLLIAAILIGAVLKLGGVL